MRVVAWNCCGKLAKHHEGLRALRPDIAVVSESTEAGVTQLGDEISHLYLDYATDRGLSLLAFAGSSLEPCDVTPRVPWALAARAIGPLAFTVIGVWTVGRLGWPSYADQITATIEAYRDELSSGQAVLAGDFNCWAGGQYRSQHLANIERFQALGMVSAYHERRGVPHGEETDPTIYWQYQHGQPFHCDFMFVPHCWAPALRQVTVGTFDDWVRPKISDHVPILAEIDTDGL